MALINGGSASSSAKSSPARCRIIAARCFWARAAFGKGSVQTVIPLPGNGAMRLTTARYYTPSGRSIQGLGITPDVPVAESRTEQAHFGPEREADLNHVLTNEGGTPTQSAPARTDLPPMAKDLPKRPPEGFPTFDPTKPDTDFQLQQGVLLVHAMAAMKHAAAN